MKMIMTILIMTIIVSYIVLAVGVYTPPDSHEIDLVLEKDYTAPDSHNIPLVLPPISPVIGEMSGLTYDSSVDLSSGTTTSIYFTFDVSDASDINETSAQVIVTYNLESRTSESPCDYDIVGETMSVNCTVIHQFYDSPGIWSINASVRDDDNNLIQNVTETYTINSLDDISLNDTAINCGSLSTPSSDNKCDVLKITNIGNQNYTILQDTAYDLDDDTTSIYKINASQFNINVTDSPLGTQLLNNTPITIPGASLIRGASETEIFYIYVDISTGKPTDTYTSIQDWSITTS